MVGRGIKEVLAMLLQVYPRDNHRAQSILLKTSVASVHNAAASAKAVEWNFECALQLWTNGVRS